MGLIVLFADRLTVFMISDFTKTEKNWVALKMNDTHIDMVRAFFPLRVLSCDVNSGLCIKNYDTSTSLAIGPMRGGTQMIEIQSDLYIGWARVHLVRCCCSWHFYRSHLVIIRKFDEKYHLVGISSPFSFGLSGVERLGSAQCQGRDYYSNAIIPAAIAVLDENSMTVLLYRQDRDRILVKICGIVAWLTQLARELFGILGENNAGRCAIWGAYNQCHTYPQ
jgi:hypothetical protein